MDVVFDDLTTRAESDIQNLTRVARGMVGRWGMSDAIGPIAVTDGRQDGPLLPGSGGASEPTQELIDQEVRRIVDDAERDVIQLSSSRSATASSPSPTRCWSGGPLVRGPRDRV